MCKLDCFVGCTQSKATFVIQPVYNNYKWDRDTTDYIKFATTTQQNEINLLKRKQSSNFIITTLIILLKCTTSYISV